MLVGWTVFYKTSISDLLRSLLVEIAFSISLPSIKVPHDLHLWLLLLVIINHKHHLYNVSDVGAGKIKVGGVGTGKH